jgi:hypothetical protein
MANRYWVGGTATWDATAGTKWALTSGGAGGQAVPTSADTVFFNANSGANTVTLGANANCSTLTMTGFTGTLAFSTFKITIAGSGTTIFTGSTTYTVTGTKLLECNYFGGTGQRTLATGTPTEANVMNISITAGTDTVNSGGANGDLNFTGFSGTLLAGARTIYGSLTLSSTMMLPASTGVWNFNATSGPKTITSNGQTIDDPITFNGVGGTWQLQDAMTVGSTRTVTLTNGTLDLNSKNLTCGIFSSSNSNTRTLAFGTGQIYLTGNNATIFTTATFTGLTLTGTPILNATYSGATGTRTITTGNDTTGTIAYSVNISAGTDTVNLSTAARYINVNFTGFGTVGTPGVCSNIATNIYGNLTCSSNMTFTANTNDLKFVGTSGTQQITCAGTTWDFPITFNGIGGTFSFQDALTQGSTRAFTITNGTVVFLSGSTNTVGSFVTSGSNQKYLQSSVAGSQATLSQASGTVSVNNLTIQDIYATGGAIWLALNSNGNIDAGNNIGWEFVNFLAATVKFTRRKTKRYFL